MPPISYNTSTDFFKKYSISFLLCCGLLLLPTSSFAVKKTTPKQIDEAKLSALIEQSNKLVQEESYTEAINIYQQILSSESTKVDMRSRAAIVISMARILKKIDKNEEALQALNAALKNTSYENTSFYVEILLQKTIILAALHDFETLENTYQWILEKYFEETQAANLYTNLTDYIANQKAILQKIEVMQEKQLFQGNVPGLVSQLQKKEDIERMLPKLEVLLAKKTATTAKKIYLLSKGNLKKNEVLMEIFYHYVRFLQWQGKPDQAKKLAYSLYVDPLEGFSLLDPVSKWEMKILRLVKDKPSKIDNTDSDDKASETSQANNTKQPRGRTKNTWYSWVTDLLH